jgi:hypothetical protein
VKRSKRLFERGKIKEEIYSINPKTGWLPSIL